jgi:putative transposase
VSALSSLERITTSWRAGIWNRREDIFLDDDDRKYFLKTLGEACGMTGWRVHAWVLMSNHYHLLLETPEGNLVAGMQWLQNTYTRRFNTRHQWWGRLFGDRYKAVVVEGESPYYYETLVDYIHLNPVRARLIKPQTGQSVLDYPWSSVAGGDAKLLKGRPPWLAASAGLAVFGFEDRAGGRRAFVERLDRRAVEEAATRAGVVPVPAEMDARCSHLRKGWYWGSQAFAERLLSGGQKTLGRSRERGYRASLEQKAHDLRRAAELLAAGLRAAGLTAEQLMQRPGSDPCKVAIARTIWENTTIGQGWLARELRMGSAANVSQQILRQKRQADAAELPAALRRWLDSVKI